jgi:hypothetical protein
MQIDAYQYIAPTPVTAPRHAAIRSAALACAAELAVPAGFPQVSEACRAFSAVCAAVAPRSADLAAAERCIRIARMLTNEALAAKADPERHAHLLSLASDELTKARMQACAAVALADAGELPAWEG